MPSVFIGCYLEGLSVGLAVVLALGGLFFFIYYKGKKRGPFPAPGTTGNPAAADTPSSDNSIRKTTIEAAIYMGACLALIVFLYVWITPVMPYAGTVEKKHTRSSARKWNRVSHYVVVNGQKRSVDKYIYDHVAEGDAIDHPVAQQRYYINGKSCMAMDYAWTTAFFFGIILFCGIFLSAGAYYQYFFSLRSKPPSSKRLT